MADVDYGDRAWKTDERALERSPAYQGYQMLHWGFVAVPTIAGLDKFAHLLTNWDDYLAPQIAHILPFGAHTFMLIVGAIEILAGLLVALKPRIGGYVVGAWLLGIIGNLLLRGHAGDIVLRDIGLMVGAVAMARLATTFARDRVVRRAA